MIKKILLAIVLVVLLLVGGLLAVVATRPDSFKVSRSAVIPAPPAVVFEQVNDLHKFNEWSPWSKIDPNAKLTFEGPAAGKGATFGWAGNAEIGEGKMIITESRPNEQILMDLIFIKPFEGTSLTEFTFKPEGDGTNITWTMSGKNNFFAKAIGLVMDCDAMIGSQFEKGLENLKAQVAGR